MAYWECAAVGTEKPHDGKVTGCTGGLWNKDRASLAFLVLLRHKSAPVTQ